VRHAPTLCSVSATWVVDPILFYIYLKSPQCLHKLFSGGVSYIPDMRVLAGKINNEMVKTPKKGWTTTQ
jgi:hypothetical protein